MVFSQELLDEFITVSQRPKLRRFFSSPDIVEIIETFEAYAEFVEVQSKIKICKDPKDNFLLSLAIDGKEDFLLTGDNDLLVLSKVEKTKIVNISDFLNSI